MDKKHLLFVDDEPMVLKGLQRSLRSMRREWAMTFVNSGAEALAVMRAQTVDVVVSDMRMPEMDGAQLLGCVKQEHPQVVRIILSGQLDREMILKSVRLAHQHLSKPCDAALLKDALAKTFALNDILSHAGLKKIVAGIDTTWSSIGSALWHLGTHPEDRQRLVDDPGDALADDHEVAHVDPDAERHAAGFRALRVRRRQLLLNLDGATHGVHGAGKLREQVVAHHVDHAPPVLAHEPPHDGAMTVERSQGGLLISRHQGRVAHGIGGEHGGESTFHDG